MKRAGIKRQKADPMAAAKAAGCLCDACPLSGSKYVKPYSEVKPAKLVHLGRWPGDEEITEGRHHVGRTGSKVDEACNYYDVPIAFIQKNNLLLCKVKGKLPKGGLKTALESCRPRLLNEIRQSKASVILAADKYALRSMTGKLSEWDWMGTVLPTVDLPGVKTISTIQPAAAFHNPGLWPLFYTHLTRAWDHAVGRNKRWRWTKTVLILGEGRDETAAMKTLLRERRLLAVDVETGGLDAIRAPLNEIGFASGDIAVSIHKTAFKAYRPIILELLAGGIPLVMQNGNYDTVSLQSHGFPVPKGYRFDTLYLHRLYAPFMRHNLGIIAMSLFDVPAWKADFHLTGDEKGSVRWADDKYRDRRMLYNARDCIMTRRIAIELCSQMNIII